MLLIGATTSGPALRCTAPIIYEVHVKGFTKLNPKVPEELRGTYAGLGQRGCD